MAFLEDGNKGYPMIEAKKDQNDLSMSLVEAYILRGILPSFKQVYDLILEECIDVEEFHSTIPGQYLETMIYDFS